MKPINIIKFNNLLNKIINFFNLNNYIYVYYKKILKLCPNILEFLSKDITSVIITGTNGKTTITNMISKILSDNNIKNICNKTGANMENGILETYIKNCDIKKGSIKKYAIIECDEKYLPKIITKIKPKIVVISNIYKDQIDRMGGEENVANIIKNALISAPPSECIIYEDCNYKEKFLNIKNCKYHFFNAKNKTIYFDDKKYDVNLQLIGEYNYINASASICATNQLLIPIEKAILSLSTFMPVYGRNEELFINNKSVLCCLVKNTKGYEVILESIKNNYDCSKKDLIIAINNKPSDGIDSWLYDIDLLQTTKIFNNILVTGDCKDTLIKIFNNKNIKTININDIYKYIYNTNKEFIIFSNYSAMLNIRDIFHKHKILSYVS